MNFLVTTIDEIDNLSQKNISELDSVACCLVDWEEDASDEQDQVSEDEEEETTREAVSAFA